MTNFAESGMHPEEQEPIEIVPVEQATEKEINNEEERHQTVENATVEVLSDFDADKLATLRAEINQENFNYDGNPILNELVQDLKSNLMHKHIGEDQPESISHKMDDLNKLDEIYDDVDFKSTILLALKK